MDRLETQNPEVVSPPPPSTQPRAQGQRLHPLTLVQRVLKSLPALFFVLLPFLGGSSDTNNWVALGFLILYSTLALPLIIAQYLRFQYWITGREVVVHSGVFTRRKRSIPLDRIQNIIIERSLLPRLMGTAKVKIETAGSKSSEGVLEYVKLDEAQRIREVVRRYQRQLADASSTASEPLAPRTLETDPASGPRALAADTPLMLYTMPLSRILLSGAFRFSLIYIALIFSGLQYVMDALDRTPEDIADWLLGGGLDQYTEVAQGSPWLVGIATVIAAMLLGWFTGIVVNLTKYYGFRLWLEGDKLHRRHGLLTVHEGTIPLQKVQSLILRSNPLMRRFGWYRLELQTMGYDVEQQGYQVAVPFARQDEILALAPHIRPFEMPETFTSVSPITIRRMFIRYSVGLLVLLAVPVYYWRPALWGLLALPLLLYLAFLQYRNHGYALHNDVLYIRRGFFQHYIWVVPTDKFQVFYIEGSFFQRRLGLRSLVVDTAGAGSFRFPQIVDVVTEAAETFTKTLYDRFQAHFAPDAPTEQE